MILDSRMSSSRRILPILSLTGLLLIVLYFVVSGLQSSHRIVPGFIDHIQSGKSHVEEVYQSVVGTSEHDHEQASVVPSTWEYVPAQHARNYGLSSEQCSTAFPNFYHEIDRATAWWAERGGILEGDLDIGWQNRSGMMRLLIHDQQVCLLLPDLIPFILTSLAICHRQELRCRQIRCTPRPSPATFDQPSNHHVSSSSPGHRVHNESG